VVVAVQGGSERGVQLIDGAPVHHVLPARGSARDGETLRLQVGDDAVVRLLSGRVPRDPLLRAEPVTVLVRCRRRDGDREVRGALLFAQVQVQLSFDRGVGGRCAALVRAGRPRGHRARIVHSRCGVRRRHTHRGEGDDARTCGKDGRRAPCERTSADSYGHTIGSFRLLSRATPRDAHDSDPMPAPVALTRGT
jgi:hypothetical protein